MNQEIKTRIEQIKRGEVPQGYKKTKVGIVPSEWKESHLKSKFNRLKRKNAEGNTNVLTISAQHGLINQNDFFNKEIASEDKTNYYLLHNGDFAYNKSYSNGYPYGAIKKLTRYNKGVVSPLYICFSPTEENKCPDYYEHYFESGYLNKEIKAFAQEGARNHGLLNIAVDDFFNSYIVSPSFPEQQKIADILTTQDKVIELKEKLIAEKQQKKKWLMQNLLTGKKRLKGFSGEWKKEELRKILFEKSERSTENNQFNILSSTTNGVMLATDYYTNRQRASKDNKGYKILRKNQVVFSPQNIWLGNINVNLSFNIGIVSPSYKIYDISKQNSAVFWSYHLKSFDAFRKYDTVLSDGASVCRKNLDSEAFMGLIFFVPPLPEQTAIAEILSTTDREIELLQKDLAEEKQKKKALMQLLLTGIVRV